MRRITAVARKRSVKTSPEVWLGHIALFEM